jgi:GT2 family glycosyltransferase
MITIIIPAYNCQEELNHTLSNLPSREKVRIIVVDDGSPKPLWAPTDVTLIRHQHNKGVGAAFDTGVGACDTEQMILMGADVVPENEWMEKTAALLYNHPMSLICASCSGFTASEAAFRPHRFLRYGAHILRSHRKKVGPHMITDVIQAKWNSGPPAWEGDVGRISCILGAFYLTTKQLYTNIGGWMGHKHWGGLEPMISLRAKRSGYPIFVAKDLEAAHHFGRTTVKERAPRWDLIFYNKLLMAETMFEDHKEIYDLLFADGGNKWSRTAEAMIRREKESGYIEDMREFHRQNWPLGLIKIGEEL